MNKPTHTTIYNIDFKARRVTRIVTIDYKQKSFNEVEAETLRKINAKIQRKKAA